MADIHTRVHLDITDLENDLASWYDGADEVEGNPTELCRLWCTWKHKHTYTGKLPKHERQSGGGVVGVATPLPLELWKWGGGGGVQLPLILRENKIKFKKCALFNRLD